jgi:hypothetical protein
MSSPAFSPAANVNPTAIKSWIKNKGSDYSFWIELLDEELEKSSGKITSGLLEFLAPLNCPLLKPKNVVIHAHDFDGLISVFIEVGQLISSSQIVMMVKHCKTAALNGTGSKVFSTVLRGVLQRKYSWLTITMPLPSGTEDPQSFVTPVRSSSQYTSSPQVVPVQSEQPPKPIVQPTINNSDHTHDKENSSSSSNLVVGNASDTTSKVLKPSNGGAGVLNAKTKSVIAQNNLFQSKSPGFRADFIAGLDDLFKEHKDVSAMERPAQMLLSNTASKLNKRHFGGKHLTFDKKNGNILDEKARLERTRRDFRRWLKGATPN